MNLRDALRQIARGGGLNADELFAYTTEDHVGGRDTGDWDGMSTFEAEGQILYALIRAMRPERVVEIGIDSGGTSTHILSALAANDYGQLYSIDIKAEVGANVPGHLRDRWTICVGDALTAPIPKAEFVFEDGPHDYKWTKAMLERLKSLNPKVILSHDMYTHRTYGGFDVERAFRDALGVDTGVLTDGSIAGLGYWWNPDWNIRGQRWETVDVFPKEIEEEFADFVKALGINEAGEPDSDDDVVSAREVRKADTDA